MLWNYTGGFKGGGGVAQAIDFNDSSMYIIAQAGKIILFIRNK